MTRYFLALPLPDSARERLAAARPPEMRGMKLVRPDLMHVTLHFLGELDKHDVQAIKQAFQEIHGLPTSLNITGVGVFPKGRPPRVIWAGIEENPLLNQLHQKLGESLQQAIGLQPEDRPFSPHVTLARLNRRLHREQLQDYWEEQKALSLPEIPVNRFVLYESLMSAANGRVEYREAGSWPLDRQDATTDSG